MQVIIFQNEQGGVATCIPTGELSIEQVLEKDCPKGRGARIVNIADLPNQYQDFYDAWEMDATSVKINKAKAIELTKKRLRAERESLLAKLDVQFQRALEEGKDTKAIVAEKQRLRDITNLATESKSLEELRALKAEV